MSAPQTALALLSGGLDSAAATFFAQKDGWEIRQALTFDYGQRAAGAEQRAAARFCLELGIPHRILSLPFFREFQKPGALLKAGSIPAPTLTGLDDQNASEKSAKAVWVPNRNGILIEIASGIAEDAGIGHVIVGFNREEAATFPDNSAVYLEALTQSLSYSTSNHVKVISPTLEMDKTAIVKKAKALGLTFDSIWSCYENGERMCGRCESCMRLKRALKANEVLDEGRFADPHFR